MAERLKGAEVAKRLNAETIARVEALKEKEIFPTLAVLRVGAIEDDLSYEIGLLKRCTACGVEAKVFAYPEDITQEAMLLNI